ncbi:MAG TPA: RagB/SusD family nutrient uptake outer membrane protein [Gemmatimonadales bacterium]|nr:RagB/SusD family nutrient uptake outer membrane protein [Gemmatimonadales bacterium]
MKRSFVKASIGAAGFVMLLLVPLQGCTDLTETPQSGIEPSHFFKTEPEVLASLAGTYAQLRSTLDDYYNVSEISTDEMVVPTRGQDWYDGGTWLDLHYQTWNGTSAATGAFFNGAWNGLSAGIARANVLLDALKTTAVPNQAEYEGEARVLRAFYYYLLMDLFGGVPLATTSEVKQRPRVTRDSLFKFIESELIAARADLPLTRNAANNGRITKGAVDAILASMYLNAGVFTKDSAGAGAINATAYNSCSGVTVSGGLNACQAAGNRADSIINSGVYQLADTFAKSFRADNASSTENILVVKFIPADGLGLNFVMRALHYNQYNPSPWNGFATLAQTYNAFDAADQRRQIFLVGPQRNVLTGALVNDRTGNPLIFTTTIADVTQATEGEGARIYKWPADPAHIAQNNGNDYAWFRLGEIYLIKAEAELAGATGTPAPLSLVNTLRARVFNPAKPRSAVTADTVLAERLFELTGEAKRRQDLIRFGKYTDCWQYKTPCPSGARTVLMPIPHGQIDANPLMKQNPGYP